MPPAVMIQPSIRRFRATATSKTNVQKIVKETIPCCPDSSWNRVIASTSKGNAKTIDDTP